MCVKGGVLVLVYQDYMCVYIDIRTLTRRSVIGPESDVNQRSSSECGHPVRRFKNERSLVNLNCRALF